MKTKETLPLGTLREQLKKYLQTRSFTTLFIVIDARVDQQYPDLFHEISIAPVHKQVIKISEKQKSLPAAGKIWQAMLDKHMDKSSLLVNCGGGVTCDLGGFVAANYKRGIEFINIPTTLLAMVDAAIGGKNGINFGGVKNSVGTIALPSEVFTDMTFLNTLPSKELYNGFGELVKYALIGNKNCWDEIRGLKRVTPANIKKEWIDGAISYKEKIVKADLHDQTTRRLLNFGHTVGHAIEAYLMGDKRRVSHGHAVAIGIVAESFLSHLYQKITRAELFEIKAMISSFYPLPDIKKEEFPLICERVKNDKKNERENIYMTLLDGIGKALPNQKVSMEDILRGLNYIYDEGTML